MRKHLITIVIICCFVFISGNNLQASQTSYTVQSGDSLWKVSQSTGVSVAQLKELNGLQSDLIKVGQVLQLNLSQNIQTNTSAAASTPIVSQTTYTIMSGDSLWGIAQKYGTTVAWLKQANNLRNDFLQAGDSLIVTGHLNQTEVSRGGSRSAGFRVIEFAGKYLGTPYVYGGMSPSGFDCSGFVSYVLKNFGISVPRTAASQFSSGTAVDKGNLAAGDLVFFRCGGSSISHVGIYSGSGKFIHSSSPRSGGVITSSLNESYYATCYAGARRVL